MLVIGHRGAAGLAAENTLEAMQAGIDAGADMLEFDVRVTSDNVPILCHDSKLYGMRVASTRLSKLRKSGTVTTLKALLDEYFGKILLNLEMKSITGIDVVYEMIKKDYVKVPKDWDNLLISSFHATVLLRLRRRSRDVNLSLLHSINPMSFLVYHRKLNLSAAGWHRLHFNKIVIPLARKLDIFTYVHTVNRPEAAMLFAKRGVDGVVTDYPNKIAETLAAKKNTNPKKKSKES